MTVNGYRVFSPSTFCSMTWWTCGHCRKKMGVCQKNFSWLHCVSKISEGKKRHSGSLGAFFRSKTADFGELSTKKNFKIRKKWCGCRTWASVRYIAVTIVFARVEPGGAVLAHDEKCLATELCTDEYRTSESENAGRECKECMTWRGDGKPSDQGKRIPEDLCSITSTEPRPPLPPSARCS